MKRMLVAAVSWLLCVAAAGMGAATTPIAPPDPAPATPLSREQYLPKLQEFYVSGKAIYDGSTSDKLSDQDVGERFDAFLKWANEAGNWMSGAISPAATAQFTTWRAQNGAPPRLAGSHPQATDDKFSTLNIVLPQLLENLRTMIASAAPDPQKAKADGSK